jgi:Tol biopolymer transport system component
MALAGGSRFGPYEVVGPIAAGGMGEVYLARDTTLGREVALKVLPDSVARDPERVARFAREARTLAALNHPHIAQIHGFETSGDAPALIMEFVEGATLADRLVGGALPPQEAVAIARQIADALCAAHDQGIVHRDLKPANVKVRSDGTVKVLDFGLAKALGPDVRLRSGDEGSSAAAGSDASQSPTITSPAMLTSAGMILGTAAYMSPEQAKGRPADQQSDVWAFGCVLYEMLTGRRAFEGEDVADTMAAVLRGDPDWNALPTGLPSGVTIALRRSLARDRRDRLRHVGDIRILLDEFGPASATAPVTARTGFGRREAIAWALAAILLIATGAAVAMRERPSPAASVEPTVFSIEPPEGIELTGAGNQVSSVFSPDGHRIAFVAQQGGTQAIWLRDLSRLTVDRLAGSERAVLPFWSPDGRSIGFFADDRLRVIDTDTGAVRVVAESSGGGGAWSADGTIVFARGATGGLVRVPAAGGAVEPVTTVDPSDTTTSHRYPSFLPDGRRFVFSVQPRGEVRLGSLDSSETTLLFAADSQAQVVRPGQIFFVRQGTLYAQGFDLERGVTTGDAVTVERSVLSNAGAAYHAFSVSDTGHLAYRAGQIVQETQLTWTDRAGRVIGLAGKPDLYRNPALSPDDARLAVEVTNQAARTQDIWLLDLGLNVLSRLTVGEGNDVMPVWSPDGARILFASDRGTGRQAIFRKGANSAAAEELVLDLNPTSTVPYSWSPDGRLILHRLMNGVFFSTGILATAGNAPPRLYAERDYVLTNAEVSPDGRFVAYTANDSGRFEVFVESFPEPGSRWPVSREGGGHPRWRPDGRELYYYAPDGSLMATPIQPGAASPVGVPTPLFRTRLAGGPTSTVGFTAQYDVTRDGRFLLNVPVADPPRPVIHVVLNWAAGRRP